MTAVSHGLTARLSRGRAGNCTGGNETSFSPVRFSAYARSLADAVYELRREQQMYDYGASTTPVSIPRRATAPRPALQPPQRQPVMAETPAPTPLPNVDLAKPVDPKPAASGFAASLRSMMDEARADLAKAREDGLSKVKDAVGKLTEAKQAVVQVSGSMAKTIEDEAASVMAEIGQISNMGPE